ncbi:T9SS type A sorting domain-containing protein [Algibacter sp.]|nr:T9SS type A sorting domain-containing protein [Algibacter sp.]MDA9069905.1 T9SS type A sorting domain-containing protein [Algibacter sp.]MDA9774712.1 T9SS type A sorting domain-containing protein [Algibacter sp.]MDC1226282.1 T9SS type A sorting domain-containing protein [Algibacter sp.]
MKKFILLILVLQICCFCSKTYGQVAQFPYLEGFENETFTQGENLYFITDWFGNYVDNRRVFQENINVRTGAFAMGLWPVAAEGEEEEEVEVFAQLDLDLTGMENVVAKFWVATEATAAYKHVKLYLKQSMDKGLTFGPKFIMGTDYRGFLNADTPYQEFTFPLHTSANNNPNVVLQFIVKSGARNGTVAKLFIDDVYIYAAPEDVFPPVALEPKPLNVNEINIGFNESVDESALDPANYIFSFGSPTGHSDSESGGHKITDLKELPTIGSITHTEPDMLTLNLNRPISIGKYYDLEISNIKDLAGNTMVTSTSTFIYNPLTEGLVISEIMYDEPPKEQNDNLEFIELYNNTDAPIELGGLMIKGGIASGKLPEFALQPSSYWVTAKNSAAFYDVFGVIVHEWMGANLSNDEAESLFIVNTNHHSGVMIDSLTYTPGKPWPEGAAGQGHSMELIDPLSDNSNPVNWKNSSNYFGNYKGYDIYASPGSATLGTEDKLSQNVLKLYPNPVTNGILNIESTTGNLATIYNALGQKVFSTKIDDSYNIQTFNLSGWQSGVYFVKISDGRNTSIKKLILR